MTTSQTAKTKFTWDRVQEIGRALHETGQFPKDMTNSELREFTRIQTKLRATSRDIVISYLFKEAQ